MEERAAKVFILMEDKKENRWTKKILFLYAPETHVAVRWPKAG